MLIQFSSFIIAWKLCVVYDLTSLSPFPDQIKTLNLNVGQTENFEVLFATDTTTITMTMTTTQISNIKVIHVESFFVSIFCFFRWFIYLSIVRGENFKFRERITLIIMYSFHFYLFIYFLNCFNRMWIKERSSNHWTIWFFDLFWKKGKILWFVIEFFFEKLHHQSWHLFFESSWICRKWKLEIELIGKRTKWLKK